MRYAVIMAGGAGVRLWPLSRSTRPKQVVRLFGGSSLLRHSFERTLALHPPEQICVITTSANVEAVKRELPELPSANLFSEPVGRDSANAVALAAALLIKRDPDAVIGTFTADHIISPIERFSATVERAYRAAEASPGALVTMGIRPNRPDTNYGYIRRGERVSDGVFKADKFTEKPGVSKAIHYLASGDYYWNSGMFAWRASAILEQLEKHLPQTFAAVTELAEVWDTDTRTDRLNELYPKLMKISIDFAVMERAEQVLVVEMDCHWVDVGSWPAIEAVIGADSDGNVSATDHVIHLGSRGNIVVSEEKHLIATIGVDDLVIVHTPDATLICTKRDSTGIKELVDNIRSRYGEEYL